MDLIDTLMVGEKVTSTYAETYFHDDGKSSICESKDNELLLVKLKKSQEANAFQNDFQQNWVSPSDLLIGIIELTPPFTSKITRGITHEGIVAIGDRILEKERQKFEKELKQLIRDNDAAWEYILGHEKQQVKLKVWNIFKNIFEEKSKMMTSEISIFYEYSLQELEDHLRSEIQHTLLGTHTNIISDLNIEISRKLKEERGILEKNLKQKYRQEIKKITEYYKLLSDYEFNRNNILINKALHERNDALNVFYKQVEAETMTSTMYIMCMERKKCKIKQLLLENYQSSEVKRKLENIKAKQETIDALKQKERLIPDIDSEWKGKIKKIVQLFLKFISYSLKLLPEQSTFLLDLEKLFVLQLNEIQKQPEAAPQILKEFEDSSINNFQFEEMEAAKVTCDKTPFKMVGDTSDSIPTPYGSRETLPSHKELPAITLLGERRFIYAKCNKFDEVRNLLKSQICKCLGDKPEETPSHTSDPERVTFPELDHAVESIQSESSIELMEVDDIKRMQDCPYRYCQDWTKNLSFDVSQFDEFTEENYKIVLNRLSLPEEKVKMPDIISAKEIAHRRLPFIREAKAYHDAVTQYSSDEDVTPPKAISECTCVKKELNESNENEPSRNNQIEEIMVKRRISIQRLLFNNPNLVKVFTDESFDLKTK